MPGACGGSSSPGLMASFMPPAYIRSTPTCQGGVPNHGVQGSRNGPNRRKNANDHEQRARVHPAQPSYSVVVPAPELSSIDVAVGYKIGTIGAFCKGGASRPCASQAYCGTSLTTGPLTAGATGAFGCSVF